MKDRFLRVVLVATLLCVLVALPGVAGAESAKAPHATGIHAAANSAPPDPYENDDSPSPSVATQVTSDIPFEGDGFYTQAHTIDTALGDTYDVDWYYFNVTDEEISTDEVKYLIEAISLDQDVDLVVEVYKTGVMTGNPVTDIWTLDPAAFAANDDSFGTYNPTVALIPDVAGNYWVRVRPYYSTSTGFDGHAGAYTFRIQKTLTERIAGSDRVATAVQVSKRSMSTSPLATRTDRTILLANSMNYPDALAGAALVRANGTRGSLLLTPQASLPSTVAAEIVRSGATHVYVLGSESVVSNTVLSQVQALSPSITVTRLAGSDRFATSIEIAKEARLKLGVRRFAIVAYGLNYPDALAAAPIATYDGIPIILTRKEYISTQALATLSDIGATDVIIVGSTSVVSNDVFDACAVQMGGTNHVLRVYGANRYETAKEIALWSSDLKGPGARGDALVGTVSNPAGAYGLNASRLGLASGENFPDALSGGVFCGQNAFPVLLTPKSTPSPYIYDVYLQLPAGKTDFFNDAGSPPHIEMGLTFGSEAAVGKLPLLVFSLMQGF